MLPGVRQSHHHYDWREPGAFTALAPKIGYDKAAAIAKAAHKNGTTLREEAVRLGHLSEADFDRLMRPERMTRPG